jgi:sugar phosphate isomerase/epimerase
MSVPVLSAFGDEIAPELALQIDALRHHEIRWIDIRSIDGINVLKLSPAQRDDARNALNRAEIHVSTIGSPVNKVTLTQGSAQEELDKLGMAFEAAKAFGTRKVRIFSPEASDLDADTDAVCAWMQPQIDLAANENMVLLHENDAKFFGAYATGARRLFDRFGGPSFRAVYDFSNDVLLGQRASRHWLPWIVEHLDSLHIKDAIEAERRIVPAGEGDGEMVMVFRVLNSARWEGMLALEPHLQAAGALGGFSGPERFAIAVNALKKTMKEAGWQS